MRTITLITMLAFALGCSSKDDANDEPATTTETTPTVKPSTTTPAASTSASTATTVATDKDETESPSVALPLLTPPVKEAAPAGFLAITTESGLMLQDDSFNTMRASDIRDRFFKGGPTDIFRILGDIDGLLTNLNRMTKDGAADCVSNDPVAYEIDAFGAPVTLYAQCYQLVNNGFVEFGIKDGVSYIYAGEGIEHVAAIVTPIADEEGQYEVKAWLGIGYTNDQGCSATWDGCSYGVMSLTANSSKKSFELAVAGIGFGFCGAQLASDGTSLYAMGSNDGPGCSVAASTCVLADDLTPATSCAALTTFASPALGRKAAVGVREFAASQYPDVPNVTLTGGDDDSLRFGPSEPADGAGEIESDEH